MKRFCIILATLLSGALHAAPVPVEWTADIGSLAVHEIAARHGETLEIAVSLTYRGAPFEVSGEWEMFYQTNGMAQSYFTHPVAISGNVARVTFTPAMDPGADRLTGFIGRRGINYRAAFSLRLYGSPGATPNHITLPVQSLDFSAIEVYNAPWVDACAISETEKKIDALGALVIGNDIQLICTNYDSAVHMPSLAIRYRQKDEKTGESQWRGVWDELTRWKWLLNTYLPSGYATRAALDAALADKADRAWGVYDSHTGNYTPDGCTWISSPRITIAGGLSWQRYADSAGAMWVLEANGMAATLGGETNGFFRISDPEGNTHFEIIRGDKRLVGAQSSACFFNDSKFIVCYNVNTRPSASFSFDLEEWFSPGGQDSSDFGIELPDGFCVCTWIEMSEGNWQLWVGINGTRPPKLFIKAEYLAGGETYIKNHAPLSVAGGILCEDGVTKVVPYVENGAVKWKVKK